MSKDQLHQEEQKLRASYEQYVEKKLSLNMSRGVPGSDQLDITSDMMDVLNSNSTFKTAEGLDCRSYGGLDGILEAKKLFSQMLGVENDELIIGGNSSLNLMYDAVSRAYTHGVLGGDRPWGKYDQIKFLCPSPGYDRHFAITEFFGAKLISIPMLSDGPDMDQVAAWVEKDDAVKGIWCVPKYSNPEGITFSDRVVDRFASLQPVAKDFRIFWDNAYCVHDITDTPDVLKNLLTACKENGNENMPYIFSSTSKISFPGAGIAALASSKANIEFIKKQMFYQTICPDKVNQLRHALYFKDLDGIRAKMRQHAALIKPKFDMVIHTLDREIKPLGIGAYNVPKGGYFISFNSPNGCAKRIVALCKHAGVALTPAGATYPYGVDPQDRNIRIAPTFPPLHQLEIAMDLFCLCVKLASLEKLLAD